MVTTIAKPSSRTTPVRSYSPALSNYEVHLYDHNREILRRCPVIVNLRLGMSFNDISQFSMALIGNDALWAADYYKPTEHVRQIAAVYRTHPVTKVPVHINSYFLEDFVPGYDEQGRFLYSLGGYSMEKLLEDRELRAEDDPRYTDLEITNITESGVTSEVIIGLVDHCMGASAYAYRQNPGFVIVKHGEVGEGGGRWDGEVLLDVVQELASSDKIEFNVRHNVITKEIEFHVGNVYRDRRRGNSQGNTEYVLAERLGNLYNPSMTFNFQEIKNALYIVQEAEDETSQRLFLRMESEDDSSKIPYNRREFSLNNTRRDETETNVKLITDGRAALEENKPEVTLEVSFEDGLRHKYLVDWEFGDKFTVEYANEIRHFQIQELEITVSSGTETITPSLVEIDDTGLRSLEPLAAIAEASFLRIRLNSRTLRLNNHVIRIPA